MNQRAIVYVAAAVSSAAIVGLLAMTMREPSRRTTPTAPTSVTASAPPPPTATTTTVATATKTAPVVSASATAVASAFDPELDDSWKLLAGNAPPGAGDPFEDTDSGEPLGKLLGKAGAIRFGLVREHTTVHNEAAVAAILRRAALDIDKLDRGRTDQPHKRLPEYEAILRGLRAELRPHMDGRVMLAGQGWALASEAGEKAEAAAGAAGRE